MYALIFYLALLKVISDLITLFLDFFTVHWDKSISQTVFVDLAL
jgi:hypothetical protein